VWEEWDNKLAWILAGVAMGLLALREKLRPIFFSRSSGTKLEAEQEKLAERVAKLELRMEGIPALVETAVRMGTKDLREYLKEDLAKITDSLQRSTQMALTAQDTAANAIGDLRDVRNQVITINEHGTSTSRETKAMVQELRVQFAEMRSDVRKLLKEEEE
jgi:hypothetical protein